MIIICKRSIIYKWKSCYNHNTIISIRHDMVLMCMALLVGYNPACQVFRMIDADQYQSDAIRPTNKNKLVLSLLHLNRLKYECSNKRSRCEKVDKFRSASVIVGTKLLILTITTDLYYLEKILYSHYNVLTIYLRDSKHYHSLRLSSK